MEPWAAVNFGGESYLTKYLKTLNSGHTLWMSPFLPPKSTQGILSKDKNSFKTDYYLLWLVITYDVLLHSIIKLTWSKVGSKWKRHSSQKHLTGRSCGILTLSDLVFIAAGQKFAKSSSRCQRCFQVSRTAHPTGAGSFKSSAASPAAPCFLLTFTLASGL